MGKKGSSALREELRQLSLSFAVTAIRCGYATERQVARFVRLILDAVTARSATTPPAHGEQKP